MMIIEIKTRFDARIIFTHECENNTIKITLEAAVKAGANLDGAYLARANLEGANLAGAYLDGAYLARANLEGANLEGANLAGATYGIATLTNGILQLLGWRWPVFIFDAHIKIGCKLYTTNEWANFSDDEISAMDGDAKEFWGKNKVTILALARNHAEE